MGISVVPAIIRYLGMEGMHGHFASSRAQHDADLIICLGARFSDRATGNVAKYAPKAKIIHIDIDAAELNKNVNVELGIAGDMKDALRRIIDQLETVERPAWQKRIAEFKAMQQAQFERVENQKELTPLP